MICESGSAVFPAQRGAMDTATPPLLCSRQEIAAVELDGWRG